MDRSETLAGVLREQPEVKDCCVLETDLGRGPEIVAVVAVEEWCSGAVLRQRCARVLGDGLPPPAVVVVTTDGARTLDPDGAAALARAATVVARHEPPADEHERALAAVVASVLRSAEPSMSDHFFDLGGDSMRLLELVNAVEDDLGAVLDPQDVLACANLREMADLVREAAILGAASGAGAG